MLGQPFNPFTGLTAKIYGGIAIAALTFGAVQTVRIEGFWFIKGYQQKLEDKTRQLAELKAASDANLAAAIAQVKAVEAKSAALAKDNQIHEQDIRRDYGARSIVYADRMRADKVCGRTAPAPAQDNPAPVDNSPGQDAIVVSRDDFDILTENTIRLKAAHDWGFALVKEGLAEPVVWPEPAMGGE